MSFLLVAFSKVACWTPSKKTEKLFCLKGCAISFLKLETRITHFQLTFIWVIWHYWNYRVSYCKVKVICLCWEYSFWFFLIFWVLCVHEKGTFMLNSSVFIFLMLRVLYRMICKNAKSFFGKNSLNVSNVKLFSKTINVFGFFMPFWWEWQLALYILSDFPGIKNLNGLNDLNSLNNLIGFNDLYSLISSKNL